MILDPNSILLKVCDFLKPLLFCILGIGFGYVIYSMTASRDLKIRQMKVTSLDALETIAGTGKLVRIEGTAMGEPELVLTNGERLAFQKLRIIGGPKGAILFDRYSPPCFCVSDGKGSIYLNASSIAEFQGGSLRNDADNNRVNIAITMLDQFDRYFGMPRADKPFAAVWTIKKGAHVSAVGEIVRDNNNRYILNAPAFWHAPLLGGQIWLQADNGLKTM